MNRPLGTFDLGYVLAPLALLVTLLAGCIAGTVADPAGGPQGDGITVSDDLGAPVAADQEALAPGECEDGRPVCDGVCCLKGQLCHPIDGRSYCDYPVIAR